jgi:hypothetical protein
MNGPGQTWANGGVAFTGPYADILDNGHTLNNGGYATWTDGNIWLTNGSTLNNLAGATFDALTDQPLQKTYGTTPTFNNAGTFRKAAGAGTTYLGEDVNGEVLFNNSGEVDVLTGTLRFLGGGTSSGSFVVAAGATLDFGPGTHNLTAASCISGAGNVRLSADLLSRVGTVNVAGTYSVGGDTSLPAGTLNLLSNAATGTATLSGGILTGPGDLTVAGLLTWTAGTISGAGHTVAAGGLAIAGTALKTLDGRTLDNEGPATWDGTGNISAGNGAVLNNWAGATFEARSNATFLWNGAGASPAFNNAGTLSKTAGTGTTAVGGTSSSPVTFNNTGTVEVIAGTLKLVGGGISSGSFYVAAGTTLEFGFGTSYLSPESAVSGPGTVHFTREALFVASTVNVAGTYNLDGTTWVDGGTVNFVSDAQTGTAVVTGGGTLTASGKVIVTGAMTLNSAGLTGTGDVTILGLLTWTAAYMSDSGHTIAVGGMEIDPGPPGFPATLEHGRTLDNAGLAIWTGGDMDIDYGGGINNLEGATFDIQGNNFFGGFGPVPTFKNAGTVLKSAGTGTANLGVWFNNTGTLEVQRGTLSIGYGPLATPLTNAGVVIVAAGSTLFLYGAYAQTEGLTLLGGGTLTASNVNIWGGVLAGPGTINGNVTNAGLVSPGGDGGVGTLTVNGNYTQTAAGTLIIGLGGTTQGVSYDWLKVSGVASLDGTLTVSLLDGFSPQLNDSFQILTFGSRNWDFATENLPDLGTLFLSPVFNSTSLTLVTQSM